MGHTLDIEGSDNPGVESRSTATGLTIETIDSAARLLALADPWNDLWRRSGSTLPTSRCELVALWFEHCTPADPMKTIIVWQAGRLVAALPLYANRRVGLRVGRLPGDHWTTAGELLIDPQAAPAVLDHLIAGLRQTKLPVVKIGGVRLGTPAWHSWQEALDRNGVQLNIQPRFEVVEVEIGADWTEYLASRSRRARREIRRRQSKLDQRGGAALRVLNDLSPAEVESWLRQGFELEDQGWKGTEKTSVLKTAGIFEFYLAQAKLLAAAGHLQLTFLEHAGAPIAFEYGWSSKAVYFSPKVAYCENWRDVSPGQILRAQLIERFHADRSCRRIDYLGPVCQATAEFATGRYTVGSATLGMGAVGRCAMYGRDLLRPAVSRLRAGFSGRGAPAESRSTADDTSSDGTAAADENRDPRLSHGALLS